MLTHCFFVLLLGVLVTPFSISSKLQDLQNVGGGQMISWEPRTMISSEDYPCTEEGLYEHPTNCSRFYRCVDFTKESRIFSRYLFQCPFGMVFAKTIQACVPGVCPEKAEKLPSGEENSTSVTVIASGIAGTIMTEAPMSTSDAGISPSPDEDMMMGSTEAPSKESSGVTMPSGLPQVFDQHTSVVSSEKLPESTEKCKTKYVQHEKYCNLFHECDDPNNLYSCYEGTAFSTERQMCRLHQFEGDLCKGKEQFSPSAELFREAFQWNEVGVVPLDKNPVYNANPYVFTNLGEIPEGFTQPKFKLPSSTSRIAPVPVAETSEKKKSRFSSLLGTFSSLLSDQGKRRPSLRKSPTRKTPVPKTTSVSKVAKKDKAESSQKENNFNLGDFDLASLSSLFPYASLLSNSLSGLASAFQPSQSESLSVSPAQLSSAGYFNPLATSGASYSPLSSFGLSQSQSQFPGQGYQSFGQSQSQSQSQFPGQGYQIGYVVSPSSFSNSPYSSLFPYLYGGSSVFGGSSDASSIIRAQLASPTSGYSQFQGYPFTSSGSYFPYSPYFQTPSSGSFGMPSPYGFIYDPTRNSISPIPMSPSYLSSIYGSLLGLNPYENLLQMEEQQPEDLKASPTLTETKPEKGTNRLKAKDPQVSAYQSEIAKKYPFLFNTQATNQGKPTPSLSAAFEARNKDGDTYQVIPLSGDEVAALASQGLLERAVTVGKDFNYDDLKNLNKGEIILATFPKK